MCTMEKFLQASEVLEHQFDDEKLVSGLTAEDTHGNKQQTLLQLEIFLLLKLFDCYELN